MSFGVQVLAGWMALVALFGFALLGWGLATGQFDDIEDTKHIPFRESDPAPWPDRRTTREV